MKLKSLTVSNVLGARQAVIEPISPVVLITGPNGAGKSSLRDAVALAMSGTPSRVKLKKEYDQLVTEGVKTGSIALNFTDGRHATVSLPDGEIKRAGKETENPDLTRAALPYVLDMGLFSNSDVDTRRTLLFNLTGCSGDIDQTRARLLERGCDAEKIEAVLPLVVSGFPAAEEDAKGRAREAKTLWKGVTGETYGEKKAASFALDKPEPDTAQRGKLQTEISGIDEQIGTDQQALGQLAASFRQHQDSAAQRGKLQDLADRYKRIEDQLVIDRADLAEWEQGLALLDGAENIDDALPCPCCGKMLILRNGSLIDAATAANAVSAADLAKRPEYVRSRDLCATAVANGERNLQASQQAAAQLEAMAAQTGDPVTENQVTDQRAKIEALKAKRGQLNIELSHLQAQERGAAEADRKNQLAAQHHADVQAWGAIAAALAPDGIPGELLATALKTVSKHFQAEAELNEWSLVSIDADMVIRAAGRDYRLLSESEQWRTNAVISEMISRLSGLKFVLFDRFDVLDNAGREDLLYWLDGLTEDGQLDTAMVFGTMKKAPTVLPDRVCAYWIENGRTEAVVLEPVIKLAA